MKTDLAVKGIDAGWSFARYEQIRRRLPRADFPETAVNAPDLISLAGRFDVFLLDAFGVLNVGETAIPGAPECIKTLRDAGKTLFVLTNAATHPSHNGPEKYRRFGYDFTQDEIISSRDLLCSALASYPPDMLWGVAAPAISQLEKLPAKTISLTHDKNAFKDAGGFIFLSSQGWNPALQVELGKSLRENPRPLLVGNPDLVAPRENGLSQEPGHFAHLIADETGTEPLFYGKPFGNAFAEVTKRLAARGINSSPDRMAMVGDTLHTDILGGAAAGLKTVLVTDHGLFRGQKITPYIERSKIIPDFIIPSI